MLVTQTITTHPDKETTVPTLDDLIDDALYAHLTDTDAVFHAWVLTQLSKESK